MSRLSLTGATWSPLPVAPERVADLQSRGLSEVAARCLAIRAADPKPGWLEPSLEHLHDPAAMLNMEAAVDRLRAAVRDKQRVRIITDYDVDGTTSSLILQAALRLQDPNVAVDYHIPNRFEEGYGFSEWAAQRAAEDGVDLIVTADIGVRDHKAVQVARSGGVDVLICDHHLPAGADVPPDATVLCPPQADCRYPNGNLAACGVSLKLAEALLGQHRRWPDILRSLLKLAAIGTVADLVPLTTLENRAIVHHGLEALNHGPHHPGLQALIDVSGLTQGEIRESSLGYRIGPRINAAGRVADAKMVVELLNCRDPLRAKQIAAQLDQLNRKRQELQHKVQEEALAMLGEQPDPFVVVAKSEADGWHRGVVGIVASRVKEEVHRPVAVIAIQGTHAVGSVRSIPGIHAVRALDSVADLLVKYGGHPAAAGFTVPTDKVDELRQRLGDYVSGETSKGDLVCVREIDAEVAPERLSNDMLRELRQLGPFGMGNPTPRLVVPGVAPKSVQVRGKAGRLLKFDIRRPGAPTVEAVWWGRADQAETLKANKVDLLGSLGENVWRGRRTLQFQLDDARVSASS